MASHKPLASPVSFAIPPAVMAPKKCESKAPSLRFRFGFELQGRRYRLVSTNKSQTRTVRTTVGISVKARNREATI